MAQMFADLLQVNLSLVFIAIVACIIILRIHVKYFFIPSSGGEPYIKSKNNPINRCDHRCE